MGIAVADFIVQYSASDGTKDLHHSRLRLLPGPRTRLGPQTFLQTHSSLPPTLQGCTLGVWDYVVGHWSMMSSNAGRFNVIIR